MRLSRTTAVALLSAAAFCTTAPVALADYSGRIESSPHAVHPGDTVQLSTEECRDATAALVHVDIDGIRHWIWLTQSTSDELTGSFVVPERADAGRYIVEGRCAHHGREVEGSFWVKHRTW